VVRDSSECCGRSGGDGGRHCAHSRGRTCVHKTDLGPCASQKCVSESCQLSQSKSHDQVRSTRDSIRVNKEER
jgi:hypothetical protein